MRYLLLSGNARIVQLTAANNKLGGYPSIDTRVNCDARFSGWLDAAQAGFDPETYNPASPPPIGVSAYHMGSWREAEDAPGSVELPVHPEVETLLFDGTGAARLTPEQRALLHHETPGRGACRLVCNQAILRKT